MDVESVRSHCLAKKGVTEGFPFGEEVLVFKVMNKMFALVDLEGVPPGVNLKCAPERSAELRESYDAITPGYHMDKRHWNTVRLDGEVPERIVEELIDHSYELVVAGLRRADREALTRFRTD